MAVLLVALVGAPGFVSAATSVVQVDPRDGASNVAVERPVQVHFSKGLKLATLAADTVRLLAPTARGCRCNWAPTWKATSSPFSPVNA